MTEGWRPGTKRVLTRRSQGARMCTRARQLSLSTAPLSSSPHTLAGVAHEAGVVCECPHLPYKSSTSFSRKYVRLGTATPSEEPSLFFRCIPTSTHQGG